MGGGVRCCIKRFVVVTPFSFSPLLFFLFLSVTAKRDEYVCLLDQLARASEEQVEEGH